MSIPWHMQVILLLCRMNCVWPCTPKYVLTYLIPIAKQSLCTWFSICFTRWYSIWNAKLLFRCIMASNSFFTLNTIAIMNDDQWYESVFRNITIAVVIMFGIKIFIHFKMAIGGLQKYSWSLYWRGCYACPLQYYLCSISTKMWMCWVA